VCGGQSPSADHTCEQASFVVFGFVSPFLWVQEKEILEEDFKRSFPFKKISGGRIKFVPVWLT